MPEHKAAQDPAIQAYDAYSDLMFPFLKRAEDREGEDMRAQLKKFVKRRARIDLRPIWKAKIDQAQRKAAIRRFSVKPRSPGAPYVPKTKKAT